MSTILNNMVSSKVLSALDTYVYTTNSSGKHLVSIKAFLPANSGLSVVLKQNSTTIATSTAPTPTQPELNLSALMSITAGDTISFVLTSSAAADQGLNSFKAIIRIALESSLN
jgi:hypothetical protein